MGDRLLDAKIALVRLWRSYFKPHEKLFVLQGFLQSTLSSDIWHPSLWLQNMKHVTLLNHLITNTGLSSKRALAPKLHQPWFSFWMDLPTKKCPGHHFCVRWSGPICLLVPILWSLFLVVSFQCNGWESEFVPAWKQREQKWRTRSSFWHLIANIWGTSQEGILRNKTRRREAIHYLPVRSGHQA